MKNSKGIFGYLLDSRHRSRTISYTMVIAAYIILEVLLHSGSLSNLFQGLLVPATCYLVAAIGLNLNVGVSGELNLGQAGFMAVGAFSGVCVSGLLAGTLPAIPRLILAIIVGMLLTAGVGFLIGIPVLKLQGDYLAIVTLAFGQIVMNLIMNLYVAFDSTGIKISFVESKFDLEPGGKFLINGPMGATGTQRIATFTAGTILVLFALVVVYNLIYSRNGRAIMAARDNRIAAESIALYGLNYSTMVASKFDYNTSILILVYVVLGGLGNINGTLISTVVLFLLPQLLRGLQDYRMLIYAVILIVIMLVTNNNVLKTKMGSLRRKKA